jgi:5-methylcytosine-specific restriction protein A
MSYDGEGQESAWRENSERFRKFWTNTILDDSVDEINDAEIDEVVRILDMSGKGNTKDTQSVARVMIPQGVWRRMFNEIHAIPSLRDILTAVLTSEVPDDRAVAIDRLYKENEKRKNSLTGPSASAVNAMLAAYAPFDNLSIVSINHRVKIIRSFGFMPEINMDSQSIGQQVVSSNNAIIRGFEQLGITGIARALSDFCYEDSVRVIWEDSKLEAVIPDLKPGQEFTNPELCQRFGCSTQGGMRRSLQTNTLVIVSNHINSVYGDEWTDEVLHYTGMGLKGDQDVDFAQNKTLKESTTNGIAVHLFEVFKKKKYHYQGRVELAAPPYLAQQPDQDGQMRQVWMFPLKLVGPNRSPTIASEVLTQKQEDDEKKAHRLSDEQLALRAAQAPKKARSRLTSSHQYQRNPYIVEQARRRADGLCQLCDQPAPFKNKKGTPFLEVHHVQWLAKGGTDTLDNTVALCPNCHRKMHSIDRKKDRQRLTDAARLIG